MRDFTDRGCPGSEITVSVVGNQHLTVFGSQVLEVQSAAQRAFRALECRDFARVDVQMIEGQAVVVNVNTLCCFDASSAFLAAGTTDQSVAAFMTDIVETTYQRYGSTC
ncbi:MAG: hypothetical protein GKR90_26715 [Pseudomonadales bacterium]|nr:hypothetical protein [Pseudomonadales bacterium]